jgi:hypothetical protein
MSLSEDHNQPTKPNIYYHQKKISMPFKKIEALLAFSVS